MSSRHHRSARSFRRRLPNGSTLETVHSVSYFTYGNAWYRPSYSAGGVSSMVVAKPG